MISSLLRRACILSAVVAAVLVLAATAAFGATYNKNLIVSNANMRAAGSMSAADVQSFLNTKAGPLKSKSFARHNGGATATAAQIIWEAAQQWGISPKVLLTMLQKEQSLIDAPTTGQTLQYRFDWAVGMGVPDSTGRDYFFQGFGNQLWYCASRLDGYGELKNHEPTYPRTDIRYIDRWTGSGDTQYMPTGVAPTNISTWKLYVYNPSVTGNSNFWTIYNRYFGDPNAGDTLPPTTTASVEASYNIVSMIRLVAADNIGGSGIGHTYYKIDGGATQEGSGVHVRAVGSHSIEYWSVDRAGNEETPHKATRSFMVNAAAGGTPVFRFYNTKNYSHFYTAVGTECDAVVASLWGTYTLDGVAYQVNPGNERNNTSLHRFRNKVNGSYLYTASQAERDAIALKLASTYEYEGVSYKVCVTPPDPPAGSISVYRFQNFKRGTYFYTASEAEKNAVATTMASTYRLEGVAFYLAP